jgi:plastocyanin
MPLKLAGFAAGLMFLAACGSSTAPAGGGGGGGGCTPTASKVCMGSASFNPATLTVSAGTTVSWQNTSGITHTVTSATGSTLTYDNNVPNGMTVSQTFSTAGTYHYYCRFHGFDGNPPSGMAGTITVQ